MFVRCGLSKQIKYVNELVFRFFTTWKQTKVKRFSEGILNCRSEPHVGNFTNDCAPA